MKETQIKIVCAKNTKADFKGFLKLEKEFSEYYTALGIGKQYKRMSFKEEPLSNHKTEFAEYLKKDRFFIFAKNLDEYAGYLAGYIEKMHISYKMRRVGYLDSMIVAEKYRNQGIGKRLRDKFFHWLKSKGIAVCRLEVKAKNWQAIKLYKKWGFKVDELRLWKKI